MLIALLIGIFLVSFVLADITMLKALRAHNTGPAFIFALGVVLIAWVLLAGKV